MFIYHAQATNIIARKLAKEVNRKSPIVISAITYAEMRYG